MSLANETSRAQQLQERLRFAVETLNECIDVDANLRGGIPVVKGTRFPVSQLLAEIADSELLSGLALEFSLDGEVIRRLLEGLSICLDRPLANGHVSTR